MLHSLFRLLALSATLTLAAHSAHAQSEAACMDTARRSVDAARKDMTPAIPANAVKMATIKGKLVWYISPSQATAYALGVSKGFAEAAEAAGLRSQVFDAKGQP